MILPWCQYCPKLKNYFCQSVGNTWQEKYRKPQVATNIALPLVYQASQVIFLNPSALSIIGRNVRSYQWLVCISSPKRVWWINSSLKEWAPHWVSVCSSINWEQKGWVTYHMLHNWRRPQVPWSLARGVHPSGYHLLLKLWYFVHYTLHVHYILHRTFCISFEFKTLH